MSYFGFRPYVPVAQRHRNAQRELAKAGKKGFVLQPVHVEGRTIANSFWGKAWCQNLESYMDYANRLPRGRTYVRNGSVMHLEVRPGEIYAKVAGSELYTIKITIAPVVQAKWKALCSECGGGIGSLVELLQGRLSDRVMDVITRKQTGLFPAPPEVKMSCSCPDSAGLCKHIAAVFYGVGARLDGSPHLLFVLRSVNHEELITQAAAAAELSAKAGATAAELSDADLGSVFGIELDTAAVAPAAAPELGKLAKPGSTKAAATGAAGKRRTGARKNPTAAAGKLNAQSSTAGKSGRRRQSSPHAPQ